MNLDDRRLVVCVGTGGVGKTTIAAAIALGAARRGKRAMVLTIDPAHALARSLGLDTLAIGGETVVANLSAAMLDQKSAWDAFVARHATDPEVARALVENPFYQRLSTSFAGSTEYMAIEEMCRLDESGRYDLVVLDTPPSGHAIDFLRAPTRIDRLFDQPFALAGSFARFLLRRIERATGSATLREVSTFFAALHALLGGIRARTRTARSLLQRAAFVLVTGPRPSIVDDTRALAAAMRDYGAPLAAVVVNRTHQRIADRRVELGTGVAAAWLRARWQEAIADADAEAGIVEPFLASLPPQVARVLVPEAAHDLHSLADLELVERALSADKAVRSPDDATVLRTGAA